MKRVKQRMQYHVPYNSVNFLKPKSIAQVRVVKFGEVTIIYPN